MPNQQDSRYNATALSPLSSSGVLDVLYPERGYETGRQRVPSPTRPNTREEHRLAPDAIWGSYNNYRSNGLACSAVVHIAILALILGSGALFGHQVAVQAKPYERVTLIAPSLDSYALPVSKKLASGGGGGGNHELLPASKGRLPKVAMQQVTPPQIMVRHEQPKLAVEPTVVVAPQVRLAENHMPESGRAHGRTASFRAPLNRNRLRRRHWDGIWRWHWCWSRAWGWRWKRWRHWRRSI